MFISRRAFLSVAAGGLAIPLGTVSAPAAPLDLVPFFLGRGRGKGVFQGTTVKLTRRFKVRTHGRMDGNDLILTERVSYSDGVEDTAIWRFTPASHGFTGRRTGVETLIPVRLDGETARMSYVAEVPGGDGKRMRLHFADTLVRTGPRTLLNTADVSYLGLSVGTVRVEFHKRGG